MITAVRNVVIVALVGAPFLISWDFWQSGHQNWWDLGLLVTVNWLLRLFAEV